MKQFGAKGIYSGYGTSELFSAISVETLAARFDPNGSMITVGIPYLGITTGVFNKDGHELSYNQRGELWIKSKSAMKEYYRKPELTAKVKVDGWVHTGDLAEIDENGFIYIWGRCSDKVSLPDGREVYLFDIANQIKQTAFIDDAIVLPMAKEKTERKLAAHIVWADRCTDEEKAQKLNELNTELRRVLPEELCPYAYAEHESMLPYSPTTLKIDKNGLANQTEGFVQSVKGRLVEIKI